MSEAVSRNTSNGSTSSSLSMLVTRGKAAIIDDGEGDSSDDDSAPFVETSKSKPAEASTSKRASSVVSLSSSALTDPDDLEITTSTFAKAKSTASTASSDVEEDDEDDDDGLVEVNQDGSEKPLAKIKKLLSHPPREPKHRWETAYVYAFIERFTSIQKDSVYAPQTIFEFELALEAGGVPQMPEEVDDVWIPSLEPVFKDFIERVRNQDKSTGGTGGPKGAWQAWIPWWISEQRALLLSDFQSRSWLDVIRAMRDKDDKNALYKIDWERKIAILKALVDYQICLCDDVKTYINDSYGYVSSYKPQPKTKEEKEQRAKEKAEAKEEARAEATLAVAAAIAAISAKATSSSTTSKDKGKEKEKEKTSVVETNNSLAIRLIGSDTLKQVWYRIDDSPRLYVNSDPYSHKPTFVAVSDTPKEIRTLLTGLQQPPKQSLNKLKGPFAKAANGKKTKEKKKKGKALLLENEERLHEYIRDIVLPSLESEESTYFERKAKFENRRNNLIKKVQRDARMENLAAQRAIDPGYGSLRASTRLRRGARVSNGYDESAKDMEIEAAIRESERNSRKRRKSGDDEDSDEEYDEIMDLDDTRGQSEDDQFEDDDEDEEGNSRRSRKAARRSGANNSRATIPGERKSSRQQTQPTNYYEPLPPLVDTSRSATASASTSRKASVVRGDLAEFELDEEEVEEEAPFGGLEEVWSMGRYRGYYRPDRTFIKAQKGDIPLYKLAKMGLPLPPLTGPIPGPPTTTFTSDSNGGGPSSTLKSMAERIAAIDGEGKGVASSSRQHIGNGAETEDVSIPGSAVPTLLAETEDRETDDSNMLGDGMDLDDDDDDDDSDIVTVSTRPKTAATTTTNGDSQRIPSGSSTVPTEPTELQQERSVSKTSGRDTSHIQVIV